LVNKLQGAGVLEPQDDASADGVAEGAEGEAVNDREACTRFLVYL
jgi:hypothetical protein